MRFTKSLSFFCERGRHSICMGQAPSGAPCDCGCHAEGLVLVASATRLAVPLALMLGGVVLAFAYGKDIWNLGAKCLGG